MMSNANRETEGELATQHSNGDESCFSAVLHPVDSSDPQDHAVDSDTTTKDSNQLQDHQKVVDKSTWLHRYQPNGTPQQHRVVEERRRSQDRSSAPPECLRDLCQEERARMNNYLDRFSTDILPPPTMPLYLQILTYMQRWGLWAAHIHDYERRKHIITIIAEKMENVWFEGIKRGLIPQTIDEFNSQSEEVVARCGDNANYQANRKLAADMILGSKGRGGGRKRGGKRSCEIAVETPLRTKPMYPITLGELEEAGLTMPEIEERAVILASSSSSKSTAPSRQDDNDILNKTVKRLNRDLYRGDWFGVVERTPANSIGRDLELYCLFEMQGLRNDLKQLKYLMLRFNSVHQTRNTQNRIDIAKIWHDRHAAVASLLYEKRGGYRESGSPDIAIDTTTTNAEAIRGSRAESVDSSSSAITEEEMFDEDQDQEHDQPKERQQQQLDCDDAALDEDVALEPKPAHESTNVSVSRAEEETDDGFCSSHDRMEFVNEFTQAQTNEPKEQAPDAGGGGGDDAGDKTGPDPAEPGDVATTTEETVNEESGFADPTEPSTENNKRCDFPELLPTPELSSDNASDVDSDEAEAEAEGETAAFRQHIPDTVPATRPAPKLMIKFRTKKNRTPDIADIDTAGGGNGKEKNSRKRKRSEETTPTAKTPKTTTKSSTPADTKRRTARPRMVAKQQPKQKARKARKNDDYDDDDDEEWKP